MKKYLCSVFMALSFICPHMQAQQAETIYISSLFTTHIVFDTEIKYGDLSNTEDMIASIVERSKNMLSIIAFKPFENPANVTVLESNGRIHTFVLMYDERPKQLVIDKRYSANDAVVSSSGAVASSGVSTLWQSDAPPLKDVLDYPQGLFHLTVRNDRVLLMCENIFSYSDITYVILSLENNSGVSFEVSDATFRIEPKDKKKRKLIQGTSVIPQNKVGTLTAAPGQKSKVAYALDKLSLSNEQILKVDVFEHNGQRHFELSLSSDDINLAQPPAQVR